MGKRIGIILDYFWKKKLKRYCEKNFVISLGRIARKTLFGFLKKNPEQKMEDTNGKKWKFIQQNGKEMERNGKVFLGPRL